LQLSFSFRDTQGVAAAWAFEVFVRFSVLNICPGTTYLCPQRPPVTYELVVFRTPARQVARQHPEKRKSEYYVRQVCQRRKAQDPVQKIKDKRKNDHRDVKMIRPVPADHEISKEISYHSEAPRCGHYFLSALPIHRLSVYHFFNDKALLSHIIYI